MYFHTGVSLISFVHLFIGHSLTHVFLCWSVFNVICLLVVLCLMYFHAGVFLMSLVHLFIRHPLALLSGISQLPYFLSQCDF